MSFQQLLQMVRNGDPVSAGSVNGPISQVDQNVRYLYQLIQAAELGSTVYAREVTVEADAVVGMALYLDADTQVFSRGLAQLETVSGVLLTAPSSQIWGVVAFKHNATKADLLLFGYAELDISEAVIGGEVEAGTYYLSGTQEGMMVRQRPPVSVPVLRTTGNGFVFVQPQFVDFLDSHRHYRFDLSCVVAGEHTPPATDTAHVITNPDSALPGWLPADDAIFDGLAPAGAAFGYNIQQHAALYNAWPPMPVSQAYLEWMRDGNPSAGLEGVPLGLAGQAVIDRNGIWWMSDCYGDVPWPRELTTDSSISESESGPLECPRDTDMQLTLWFTKLNFSTDATVVTSLRSLDSRLVVTCSGTSTEGAVGDLEIDLDLTFISGDNDRRGYLAFKVLEGEQLHRGPIAEGIYTTSGNVLLAGDATSYLDPEDIESATVYHGMVRVDVLTAATRELAAQIVRLEGATEEHYPVLYIGLTPENQSGFVSRFDIPVDAPASSFVYRCRLLGRAAGNLPQLIVTYSKISRPVAGLNTPLTLSPSYSALTIITEATLTVADQAVEAESEPFEVEPGDIVFIHVVRDPDSVDDGYLSEMGVLQQTGIMTASA